MIKENNPQGISTELNDAYKNQYNFDKENEWRDIGAKGKANNIIEISKGINFKNVLDIGSGEGSVLKWLTLNNFCDNISSLEISESGIEQIKKLDLNSVKEIKLFDGYQIPYEDNSFDLATCSHVIEHVEHPRILIREIMRVSKYQIFEIPVDFSLTVDKKVKHFLSYGHINIFNPQLFNFLLLSEGLRIIKDKKLLYSKEVYDFLNKDNKIKLFKNRLINFIWRNIPFLMKYKPASYIVLCEKDSGKIKIF